MTAGASTCPQCHTPIAAGTRFCGNCGATIEARASAPMAKTMMGMDGAAVIAAAERAKAVAAEAAQRAAAEAAANAAAPAAAPKVEKPMAKTMMGIPLQAAALPQPAAPPSKPATPAAVGGMDYKRTMIGGAGFMPPAAAVAVAAAAAAAAAPAEKPSGRPAADASGGRTMLGVPLAETKPTAEAQPARPSGGTPVTAFDSFERSPGSDYPPPSRSTQNDTLTIRKGRSRATVIIAAVGVLVVALVAVWLLQARSSSTSEVTVRVVRIDTGDALLFEVPSAPAGAKIRFGGQEKPLQTGRASFALATESLRVGDNVVQFEVVGPDGVGAANRITLGVDHRIWLDTAALQADKAAVDVVVTAVPGTRVTVDGEELKLDAEGRGTRTYQLDPVLEAKDGNIEHIVRYRVQPPSGEAVVDELHTSIPVATMQIDRPGRDVVTDQASVEIGGVVAKGTSVTVDGVPVEVNSGNRFLYRYALPAAQTYKPRVVASAPGRAPMGITLEIRRVADLAHAAREFVADPDLTYAKLAPNPAIYRGQKIAIEGRVYAASALGGASYFQILALPCPSSQRCAMWISDAAATEVHEDDWVRVLGIADGVQQFRAQKNDEVVTVPKVQARFVLPAKP